MINFPSFCVDNFYNDPDSVREFAMKQEFTAPNDGRYPGNRTTYLHLLNRELFDEFCGKLFSIFYDYTKCHLEWEVDTSFQLIHPYSDIKDSIKNVGWIHKDGVDCIFAGVIYLSKDIDLQTGTSVFRLKESEKSKINLTSDTRFKYYGQQIDDGYDDELRNYNASFEETIRYNNIYNRLIGFDGSDWHGVNSFYNNSSEPRLTQAFFVKKIGSDSAVPLKRY